MTLFAQKPAHWLWGDEWAIYSRPAGELWNKWTKEFGPVVKYRNAFLNGHSILVADPLAIKAILIDGPDGYAWHKPYFNRNTNLRLLGQGVIWAEGASGNIKAISPAFFDTAEDLKTSFTRLIETSKQGRTCINAMDFMSRAALDVIGSAGFQHQFGAVASATAEAASITDGLSAALGAPADFKMFLTLNLAKTFPFIFNHAPLKAIKSQRQSKAAIDVVSAKLLKRAHQGGGENDRASILGILVNDQKRGDGLNDTEIADNVTTMVTAGHETTGITLAMILYELARNTQLQERVRQEVLADGSAISFDDLQIGKAPLLDAVIKEVLRLYPANIRIIRDSEKDQVVPLSEPIKTSNGLLTSFFVPKHTNIVFPLAAINRLERLWGPDADAFNADRWLVRDGIPSAVSQLPSGYDHIFTFISGPRACVGMRFALAEIRVIVSQLLSAFVFRPASKSEPRIVSPAQIMMRAQDPETGRYGIPLVVTPLE